MDEPVTVHFSVDVVIVIKNPMQDTQWITVHKFKIPYIANRSRWKSFTDGQGITNSLENFRGLLTPVNLKETRSHIRTLFNSLASQTAFPPFYFVGAGKRVW